MKIIPIKSEKKCYGCEHNENTKGFEGKCHSKKGCVK